MNHVMFKDVVSKYMVSKSAFGLDMERILYEVNLFHSKKITLAPHIQRRELKDLN